MSVSDKDFKDIELLPVKSIESKDSIDQCDPLTWPIRIRIINTIIISFMTMLCMYGSSVFMPSIPELCEKFDEPETLVVLGATLYVIGVMLGPLIFSPLSELYGRRPLNIFGYTLFALMQIPTALSVNLAMFVVFRFFSGFFGSVGLGIGAGSLSDMFSKRDRGKYIGIYFLGICLGPAIAPITSGFIAGSSISWRWEFWILLMLSGVSLLAGVVFLKETYAPVLKRKQAKKLLEKQENQKSVEVKISEITESSQQIDPDKSFAEVVHILVTTIRRPLHLLCTQPIMILISLIVGTVYGILYLLFTAFAEVWILQYHFTSGLSGLTYISLSIGQVFAVFVLLPLNQKYWLSAVQKNNGVPEPEFRLPMAFLGCFAIMTGMFIFGWTVQYKVFWFVPLIGTTLVGAGFVMTFNPMNMFIVDNYGRYAASAMAAIAIPRNIFGACFPLFAEKLFERLGYGWGSSLLAFLLVAINFSIAALYMFGKIIREKRPFDHTKY